MRQSRPWTERSETVFCDESLAAGAQGSGSVAHAEEINSLIHSLFIVKKPVANLKFFKFVYRQTHFFLSLRIDD